MKEVDIEFVNNLRESLRNRPGFRENSTHITTHCPYCEQSREAHKHGHLHINIIKLPHFLDCKKCQVPSHILTPTLLDELGITDTNVVKYVRKSLKNVKVSHIKNINEKEIKLDYKIDTTIYKEDEPKLNYISNRLNLDSIDNEFIDNFRVITNFSKFVKDNEIPKEEIAKRYRDSFDMIDNHYIGFLSFYGNSVYFRRVDDLGVKGLPRHVKFSISNTIKKPFMFIPKVQIDLLTEDPEIAASEGIMDIIGVMITRNYKNHTNTVYTVSSSKGAFRSTILKTMEITGFYGSRLSIYMDNEDFENTKTISDIDFDEISKALKGLGKSSKITAIVNLANKDFGNLNLELKVAKRDITRLAY